LIKTKAKITLILFCCCNDRATAMREAISLRATPIKMYASPWSAPAF
jgi:hypothetical protein